MASNESVKLTRLIQAVSKAMGEQAVAAIQITRETETMKRESEQVAQAMIEQSRAVKDMTTATQNISRQIHLIAQSNLQHSHAVENVVRSLGETRHITDRNARRVNETLGATTALLDLAGSLAETMDQLSAPNSNGSSDDARSRRGRKRQRSNGKAPAGSSQSPEVSAEALNEPKA
jgi:methyl-accepting chemotaxis protein